MRVLIHLWSTFLQDPLLKKVIRNTGYLFSSTSVSLVLGLVQSILAARMLGVYTFGILGTVTVYASTVNRLFSFRMTELVVKYLGQFTIENQKDRAAAVVKVAALAEAATSTLALIFLFLLAEPAARLILKDPQIAPWIRIYGLSILGTIVMETSTGVLHVGDQFRGQAWVNLAQSVFTAAIIVILFFSGGDLLGVLLAYLFGKIILGVGTAVLALRKLHHMLGPGWWRASFKLLPPFKELSQFTISTNLSQTVMLFVRDSELIWISFFLSPLEAGYYKVVLAIINLACMPITPLISTTYPEINRSVAARNWPQLRHLLRQVTFLSGGWTLITLLGCILFGNWLIQFYGPEYLPAYPALIVLLIGYGMANTFFWNRPLLLSFGKPMVPFQASLWPGLAKVALAFLVVPVYGYVGEAVLLSSYFLVSITWIALKGFEEIRKAEHAGFAGGTV